MSELLLVATIITPVVVAVVEAVKRGLVMDTKYVPLLSLCVGVLIGLASFPVADIALAQRAWAGALAGLGAAGLYDMGKSSVKGK